MTPVAERGVVSREVQTPHGPARVHVHLVAGPVGALVLGHGAGGGVSAPDLAAVVEAALALHVTVVTVEQPYRVAGRRAPAPARQLDASWEAVLADLVGAELAGLPVVAGGRSSGGRVACRTSASVGAVAVLCLAFPLVPPRAATPTTRAPELDAVAVRVLVVQGARDRFGRPEPAPGREVVLVPGDHSLHTDPAAVVAAVEAWLPGVLSRG
jgi:predicted alpha/beta-hydrolase family hydrolase